MARFQVLITDEGRVMVTTAEMIPRAMAEQLVETFRAWQAGKDTVVVISDAEIMRVHDVEIDDSFFDAAAQPAEEASVPRETIEPHEYKANRAPMDSDKQRCLVCDKPIGEGPHIIG